jgi:tetratricopeptide (TPR) repeat protein
MNLVDCYRRGLTTESSIAEVCGLGLVEFEAKYSSYLTELVQQIASSDAQPEIDVDSARAAYEQSRDDGDLSGRYAYALWKSGDDLGARRQAELTLGFEPGEPLSTAVLVSFADADGEPELAEALIAEVRLVESPNAVLIGLLAERAFNASEFARAEELFRLGVEKFPWEDAFWQGLAVTYISQKQQIKALSLMAEMADRDTDNVTVRTHLASEYLSAGDIDAARRWAREILFLDLESPIGHYLLGRCWVAKQNWVRAREEFDRTLAFDPDYIDAEVGLARCDIGEAMRGQAQARLERVLAKQPDHAEASHLLDELQTAPN